MKEPTNQNRKEPSDIQLATYFNSISDGILIEDQDRKVVMANQAFYDIFRISVPQNIINISKGEQSEKEIKKHFKYPEKFLTRTNDILAAKENVKDDILELLDGRYISRNYVLVYTNNKFSNHLWQYKDITDMVLKQKKLEAREAKYRNLIENMNLGLLEVDLNEIIVYANNSFCKQTGYSQEDLIGKIATEILLSMSHSDDMDIVNSRRIRGESDTYELRLRQKNGENLWMLISGGPIFNELNKVTGSIGIHLDISNQKNLENKLIEARLGAEAASRTREEFLAMVSHEVRTPLAAILGLQDMMLREGLTTTQNKLVNQTLQASEHLMTIINNILDFSKLSSGKMELANSYISLRTNLEKAVAMLQIRAEEKGLDLSLLIDDKIADAHSADGPRIAQIILNLVGNAIKFTDKGYVRILVEMAKEEKNKQLIIIIVQDSGIGIPQERHQAIFNVFNQADVTIARRFGGTGLGLSISKYLTELMGGQIWVGSEPGKGSSFYIRLELEKGVKEQVVKKRQEQITNGELKGVSILIVEDNEINMLIAQTILTRQEATVYQAINGKIALQMALSQVYDIILMDIQMPEMNGIDATKTLREKGYLKPIVALTANALTAKDDLINEAGFNDVITKPFSEFDLVRMVARWTNSTNAANRLGRANTSTKKDSSSIAVTYTYSLSNLTKLAQNDKAFIDRMINMAKLQLLDIANKMNEAAEGKNWEAVAALAHKIKATIDSFEVHGVAELARKLENNSPKTMKESKYSEHIAEFTHHLVQLSDVLSTT